MRNLPYNIYVIVSIKANTSSNISILPSKARTYTFSSTTRKGRTMPANPTAHIKYDINTLHAGRLHSPLHLLPRAAHSISSIDSARVNIHKSVRPETCTA